MPNLAFNFDSNSTNVGTTTGTCPKCNAESEMERTMTTRQLRVFGIPIGGGRTSESVTCGACGKKSNAAEI
ncbi:MAG: hypothetical protein HKN44_04860 [Ilumatobacter sp.]|nr:hypothetical protein [Ilumatobacter sp.]